MSGYDWRDGLGDPDRRAPRKNPAWAGTEHNDFGFDEFMTFRRVLGAEPYVAVDSGLGGVEGAVGELRHATRPVKSPPAAHGRPTHPRTPTAFVLGA